MFESVFSGSTIAGLEYKTMALCTIVSILLGVMIAFTHMKTSKYSKNFVVSLAILPTLVQLAIIMVNGAMGTAVAVMGIFGLIRFRSIAGTSKEIMSVFFAMVIGLAIGMGQITFASVITLVVCLLIMIYDKLPIGEMENNRHLKVIIPENLNYTNVFDDIFSQYTTKVELEKVKTTNMGSMFELTYDINLKKGADEKKFIDDLRVRNGNLNVIMSKRNEEEQVL